MVEAQYRARRAILRNAESFTANGVSRKGIFTTLTPGQARRFIDDATLGTANRPIWLITVPDNDGTVDTDSISWDSLTLTILKIVRRRLRGTLMFKLILAH